MQPLIDSLDRTAIDELAAFGATVSDIGRSEHGRALHGIRIGDPSLPLVSIVAGAHPDEPAGPVAALELVRHWETHPLYNRVQLAIVPIIDVDGIVAQRAWLSPWDGAIDVARYLQHRLRRLPGDDREFAWPGAAWGGTVLPECAAAAEFLDALGPAIAHLSLHGMFVAHGPWYLLDHEALRHGQLWDACRASAKRLGLPLHDDLRWGDKGFRRVSSGFSTTPSGAAMRRFFLQQGDPDTANGFGLSSMESARTRAKRHSAAPPLCAVSEFPLVNLARLPTPEKLRQRREQLGIYAAQQDWQQAAEYLCHESGGRPLALETQVCGMLDLVNAVITAALSRIR